MAFEPVMQYSRNDKEAESSYPRGGQRKVRLRAQILSENDSPFPYPPEEHDEISTSGLGLTPRSSCKKISRKTKKAQFIGISTPSNRCVITEKQELPQFSTLTQSCPRDIDRHEQISRRDSICSRTVISQDDAFEQEDSDHMSLNSSNKQQHTQFGRKENVIQKWARPTSHKKNAGGRFVRQNAKLGDSEEFEVCRTYGGSASKHRRIVSGSGSMCSNKSNGETSLEPRRLAFTSVLSNTSTRPTQDWRSVLFSETTCKDDSTNLKERLSAQWNEKDTLPSYDSKMPENKSMNIKACDTLMSEKQTFSSVTQSKRHTKPSPAQDTRWIAEHVSPARGVQHADSFKDTTIRRTSISKCAKIDHKMELQQRRGNSESEVPVEISPARRNKMRRTVIMAPEVEKEGPSLQKDWDVQATQAENIQNIGTVKKRISDIMPFSPSSKMSPMTSKWRRGTPRKPPSASAFGQFEPIIVDANSVKKSGSVEILDLNSYPGKQRDSGTSFFVPTPRHSPEREVCFSARHSRKWGSGKKPGAVRQQESLNTKLTEVSQDMVSQMSVAESSMLKGSSELSLSNAGTLENVVENRKYLQMVQELGDHVNHSLDEISSPMVSQDFGETTDGFVSYSVDVSGLPVHQEMNNPGSEAIKCSNVPDVCAEQNDSKEKPSDIPHLSDIATGKVWKSEYTNACDIHATPLVVLEKPESDDAASVTQNEACDMQPASPFIPLEQRNPVIVLSDALVEGGEDGSHTGSSTAVCKEDGSTHLKETNDEVDRMNRMKSTGAVDVQVSTQPSCASDLPREIKEADDSIDFIHEHSPITKDKMSPTDEFKAETENKQDQCKNLSVSKRSDSSGTESAEGDSSLNCSLPVVRKELQIAETIDDDETQIEEVSEPDSLEKGELCCEIVNLICQFESLLESHSMNSDEEDNFCENIPQEALSLLQEFANLLDLDEDSSDVSESPSKRAEILSKLLEKSKIANFRDIACSRSAAVAEGTSQKDLLEASPESSLVNSKGTNTELKVCREDVSPMKTDSMAGQASSPETIRNRLRRVLLSSDVSRFKHSKTDLEGTSADNISNVEDQSVCDKPSMVAESSSEPPTTPSGKKRNRRGRKRKKRGLCKSRNSKSINISPRVNKLDKQIHQDETNVTGNESIRNQKASDASSVVDAETSVTEKTWISDMNSAEVLSEKNILRKPPEENCQEVNDSGLELTDMLSFMDSVKHPLLLSDNPLSNQMKHAVEDIRQSIVTEKPEGIIGKLQGGNDESKISKVQDDHATQTHSSEVIDASYLLGEQLMDKSCFRIEASGKPESFSTAKQQTLGVDASGKPESFSTAKQQTLGLEASGKSESFSTAKQQTLGVAVPCDLISSSDWNIGSVGEKNLVERGNEQSAGMAQTGTTDNQSHLTDNVIKPKRKRGRPRKQRPDDVCNNGLFVSDKGKIGVGNQPNCDMTVEGGQWVSAAGQHSYSAKEDSVGKSLIDPSVMGDTRPKRILRTRKRAASKKTNSKDKQQPVTAALHPGREKSSEEIHNSVTISGNKVAADEVSHGSSLLRMVLTSSDEADRPASSVKVTNSHLPEESRVEAQQTRFIKLTDGQTGVWNVVIETPYHHKSVTPSKKQIDLNKTEFEIHSKPPDENARSSSIPESKKSVDLKDQCYEMMTGVADVMEKYNSVAAGLDQDGHKKLDQLDSSSFPEAEMKTSAQEECLRYANKNGLSLPDLQPKIVLFPLLMKEKMKIGKCKLRRIGSKANFRWQISLKKNRNLTETLNQCQTTSSGTQTCSEEEKILFEEAKEMKPAESKARSWPDLTEFGVAISMPREQRKRKKMTKKNSLHIGTDIVKIVTLHKVPKPICPQKQAITSNIPESKLALSILKKREREAAESAKKDQATSSVSDVLPFSEIIKTNRSKPSPDKPILKNVIPKPVKVLSVNEILSSINRQSSPSPKKLIVLKAPMPRQTRTTRKMRSVPISVASDSSDSEFAVRSPLSQPYSSLQNPQFRTEKSNIIPNFVDTSYWGDYYPEDTSSSGPSPKSARLEPSQHSSGSQGWKTHVLSILAETGVVGHGSSILMKPQRFGVSVSPVSTVSRNGTQVTPRPHTNSSDKSQVYCGFYKETLMSESDGERRNSLDLDSTGSIDKGNTKHPGEKHCEQNGEGKNATDTCESDQITDIFRVPTLSTEQRSDDFSVFKPNNLGYIDWTSFGSSDTDYSTNLVVEENTPSGKHNVDLEDPLQESSDFGKTTKEPAISFSAGKASSNKDYSSTLTQAIKYSDHSYARKCETEVSIDHDTSTLSEVSSKEDSICKNNEGASQESASVADTCLDEMHKQYDLHAQCVQDSDYCTSSKTCFPEKTRSSEYENMERSEVPAQRGEAEVPNCQDTSAQTEFSSKEASTSKNNEGTSHETASVATACPAKMHQQYNVYEAAELGENSKSCATSGTCKHGFEQQTSSEHENESTERSEVPAQRGKVEVPIHHYTSAQTSEFSSREDSTSKNNKRTSHESVSLADTFLDEMHKQYHLPEVAECVQNSESRASSRTCKLGFESSFPEQSTGSSKDLGQGITSLTSKGNVALEVSGQHDVLEGLALPSEPDNISRSIKPAISESNVVTLSTDGSVSSSSSEHNSASSDSDSDASPEESETLAKSDVDDEDDDDSGDDLSLYAPSEASFLSDLDEDMDVEVTSRQPKREVSNGKSAAISSQGAGIQKVFGSKPHMFGEQAATELMGKSKVVKDPHPEGQGQQIAAVADGEDFMTVPILFENDNLEEQDMDLESICSELPTVKIPEELNIPDGYCFFFLRSPMCHRPQCRYKHAHPTQSEYISKALQDLAQMKENQNIPSMFPKFRAIVELNGKEKIIPDDIFLCMLQFAVQNRIKFQIITFLSFLHLYTGLDVFVNEFVQILSLMLRDRSLCDHWDICRRYLWTLFLWMRERTYTPYMITHLFLLQQFLSHPDKLQEVVLFAQKCKYSIPVRIMEVVLQAGVERHDLLSNTDRIFTGMREESVEAMRKEVLQIMIAPLKSINSNSVYTLEQVLKSKSSLGAKASSTVTEPELEEGEETNVDTNSEAYKTVFHQIESCKVTHYWSYLAGIYIDRCVDPVLRNTTFMRKYVEVLFDVHQPSQTPQHVNEFLNLIFQKTAEESLQDAPFTLDVRSLSEIVYHLAMRLMEKDRFVEAYFVLSNILDKKLPHKHLKPVNACPFPGLFLKVCILAGNPHKAYQFIQGLAAGCVQEHVQKEADYKWYKQLFQLVRALLRQNHVTPAIDVLGFCCKEGANIDEEYLNIGREIYREAMRVGDLDVVAKLFTTDNKLLPIDFLRSLLLECYYSNMKDITANVFFSLLERNFYAQNDFLVLKLLPHYSVPEIRLVIKNHLFTELYSHLCEVMTAQGFSPTDDQCRLILLALGEESQVNMILEEAGSYLQELQLSYSRQEHNKLEVHVDSLKSFMSKVDRDGKRQGLFHSALNSGLQRTAFVRPAMARGSNSGVVPPCRMFGRGARPRNQIPPRGQGRFRGLVQMRGRGYSSRGQGHFGTNVTHASDR